MNCKSNEILAQNVPSLSYNVLAHKGGQGTTLMSCCTMKMKQVLSILIEIFISSLVIILNFFKLVFLLMASNEYL